MNQIGSNPCQKIEIEVNLPSKLIFNKNTEDPEKDGVSEEVPEIGVEKQGSNQLPGILISRG
jgi:hypothetical protein